jgi:hypothetical protein
MKYLNAISFDLQFNHNGGKRAKSIALSICRVSFYFKYIKFRSRRKVSSHGIQGFNLDVVEEKAMAFL